MKKIILTLLLFVLTCGSVFAQNQPSANPNEFKLNRQATRFDSAVWLNNGFMLDTFWLSPADFNSNVNYITIDGSARETEGVYRIGLAGGGGGGGSSDSTRIRQDSIAVYFQTGVEIGRDTIRVPVSSSLTGGDGILIDGDSVNIKNSANLEEGYLVNWDATNRQFDTIDVRVSNDTLYLPSTGVYAFEGSQTVLLPLGLVLESATTNNTAVLVADPDLKTDYVLALPDSLPDSANQVLTVSQITLGTIETVWAAPSSGGGSENDSDWVRNGSVIYNNSTEVVVNNDTTLEGAKFEVWGGSGGEGANYSVNLLENQNQIIETATGFPLNWHTDTTYRQLWDFGAGDTLYNYRWANAGSPRGVDMPATSGSLKQGRVTIQNVDRPVGAYMFQANFSNAWSVIPSKFYLLGSNDTLLGWDTLSNPPILDGTSYNYNFGNNTFDSVQVFEINNSNVYEFIRFAIDSAYRPSLDIQEEIGNGSFNTGVSNFKLFPTGKIPIFEVFESGLTEAKEVEIQGSGRNLILFDTLSVSGNDTTVTLNFKNSQGLHVYSNDASLTGILIDLDTSTLNEGFIQDFSVSIEIDTSVTAPTLYFQTGKFQLVQGTAPTLTTDNTDQTRKDVLTFRYDGAALRAKVLEVKDFRNN